MKHDIAGGETNIAKACAIHSFCLNHVVSEAEERLADSDQCALVDDFKSICLLLKWPEVKQENCNAQRS